MVASKQYDASNAFLIFVGKINEKNCMLLFPMSYFCVVT